MGFIEDIEARTDLPDEVKQQLIASHREEVDPLRARSRKEAVEAEITTLSNMGFSDAPGLLKFMRRALLSDDEQPGVILLSDNEMGLTGDAMTGANGRQEMSTADALREFVKLMPRNEEGKIAVNLSDQAAATDDHGRPEGGDGNETDEEKAAAHEARTTRLTGRKIDRVAVRGKRYGRSTVGGD